MNKNELENVKEAKRYLTVMLPKDHPVVRALDTVSFTWGSFQYDESAALYVQLCKTEKELGREATLASLMLRYNFRFKIGPVVPLKGDVLESLKECLCIDVVDEEVVGSDRTEIRETFEGMKTVTDALHLLRDQSWDLWCGVPYIAKFVFPELTTSPACLAHATGIICWLLKSYGLVKDDEPFKEWDT